MLDLNVVQRWKEALASGQLGGSTAELLLIFEDFEQVLKAPRKRRKVFFCGVFLGCLIKAYKYLKTTPSSILSISDLDLNNSEYARFNDLIRFGFADRPSDLNGEYDFDLNKIKDFFSGKFRVSSYFLVDPITKQVTYSEEKISIKETPSVEDVVAQYGPTLTDYIL